MGAQHLPVDVTVREMFDDHIIWTQFVEQSFELGESTLGCGLKFDEDMDGFELWTVSRSFLVAPPPKCLENIPQLGACHVDRSKTGQLREESPEVLHEKHRR